MAHVSPALEGSDKMGRKDIEEKLFEDYNDVFADIVNVLLFNGQQIVQENELENTKDRSRLKDADGKTNEQERDVAKWWRKSKIRLALFGVENQTRSDPDMCFRLYGYDGAVYRSEYQKKEKYPVITLVLYFNSQEHWKGNKTLGESLHIPEAFIPFFNDYHMNLFEIAWLSEEQVKMFKSDFQIVADYFVQMRKNKDYIPSKKTMEHVDSMIKLMAAITGDSRFEDGLNTPNDNFEGRKINMCEYLDRIISEGEARGEARGVAIGEARGVAIGEAKGETKGENRLAALINKLYLSGKKEEILRVSEDEAYREKLYIQYGLKQAE